MPYEKDLVKDAPNVEADGELSPEEEQRLYQHYGRSDYGDWDQSMDRTEGVLGRDERFGRDRDDAGELDADGDAAGTVGRDASGPTTDDAMTRSEEELHVGTQRRETGNARLRKYVVTEEQTRTVPVQREEVRVEREPITDANVGDATTAAGHLRGGARGHAALRGARRREAHRAPGARAPRARHRDRRGDRLRGGP